MEFEKDRSAGYLLNHLARIFARNLQDRIKPLGLSPGVFPALIELWDTDGLTQKDLVSRLDIEQATMANTLARMERDKLIERRPDPTDARRQRAWLTKRAKDLRAPALEAASMVNTDALATLPDQDRATFITTLATLTSTLRGKRETG